MSKIIFVLLLLLLVGCATSTPTHNPLPTQKPVPTIIVPTQVVVVDPTPSCLQWNQVTKSMKGQTVCVQGTLDRYMFSDELWITFFYFGKTDQFFVISPLRWSNVPEGKCLSAKGEVRLNNIDTPFIQVDDIGDCSGNFPVASVPTVKPSLPTQPVANCNIKGNISYNTGEKIYHVPGQEFYNVTEIDTGYGERWFCSEEEARAAGWRKSNK